MKMSKTQKMSVMTYDCCTVGKWLLLSPHSEKALGSSPGWVLHAEFASSPKGMHGFFFQLPPKLQKHVAV